MHSDDESIGMRLAQAGQHARALPYLERAQARNPASANLLHVTASVLQIAGRPHDAVRCYQNSAAHLVGDTGVMVGWARALLLVDDVDASIKLLDRALALEPQVASRQGSLRLLWQADQKDLAVRILRTLTDRHPNNADLLCQYAQVLRVAEHLEEAETAWRRYMTMQPGDPLGPVEAGRLAVSRGDREAGRTLFSRALQIAPDDSGALAELAQAMREPLDPALRTRLTARLSREPDPEFRALLHDALANHHERAGEFDVAATHVASMNATKASCLPPQQRYDPGLHEEEVAFAIRAYAPDLFDRLRTAGSHDHRPLFVIGLPRSGTTLLERMLAAHPAIVGVGEQTFSRLGLLQALAACGGLPGQLTADAVTAAAHWHLQRLEERLQRQAVSRPCQRIVDKLPDNYMFVGWLKLAFPHAIIVHTLRDPRDVAWSCWSTHFAKIDWSLHLEHIAHRIEQHRILMRHWRQAIPDRLVEVRYERLVANPEAELRRLLASIGVDWSPQVLDFAQRKGFVASASRHQVREGIHARSIGRWQHYADALRPILPRLEAVVAQDMREATADLKL